jgi:hypothetical protein
MNNRLKNSRCYLAGAMDRVADRGTGWRDEITPFLQSFGIIVYNPLKKPIGLYPEDEVTHQLKKELKTKEDYNTLSILMKEIRGSDLYMVDTSNFVIVDLDLDTHPCGTYEEIFWANRLKRPILLHVRQGKKNTPDWLFGTLPHDWFFSDWKSLKIYIEDVNSGKNVNTYGRWRFIDQ